MSAIEFPRGNFLHLEHCKTLGPLYKQFLCSRPMTMQGRSARSYSLRRTQRLRKTLYHFSCYPSLSHLILQFNLFQENPNSLSHPLISHSFAHRVDKSGPFNPYNSSILPKKQRLKEGLTWVISYIEVSEMTSENLSQISIAQSYHISFLLSGGNHPKTPDVPVRIVV